MSKLMPFKLKTGKRRIQEILNEFEYGKFKNDNYKRIYFFSQETEKTQYEICLVLYVNGNSELGLKTLLHIKRHDILCRRKPQPSKENDNGNEKLNPSAIIPGKQTYNVQEAGDRKHVASLRLQRKATYTHRARTKMVKISILAYSSKTTDNSRS